MYKIKSAGVKRNSRTFRFCNLREVYPRDVRSGINGLTEAAGSKSSRLIRLEVLVCRQIEAGQPAGAAGVRVDARPSGEDERFTALLRRVPANDSLSGGVRKLLAAQ